MTSWRGFTRDQAGTLSLAEEVRDAPFFATLPTGATEQHGPVVPLGIDRIVACEVSLDVHESLDTEISPSKKRHRTTQA